MKIENNFQSKAKDFSQELGEEDFNFEEVVLSVMDMNPVKEQKANVSVEEEALSNEQKNSVNISKHKNNEFQEKLLGQSENEKNENEILSEIKKNNLNFMDEEIQYKEYGSIKEFTKTISQVLKKMKSESEFEQNGIQERSNFSIEKNKCLSENNFHSTNLSQSTAIEFENTLRLKADGDFELSNESQRENFSSSSTKEQTHDSMENHEQRDGSENVSKNKLGMHSVLSDLKETTSFQDLIKRSNPASENRAFESRLLSHTQDVQVNFLKEGASYRGAKIEIQHPELGRIQFELNLKERNLDLKATTLSFKAARLIQSIESSVRSEVSYSNLNLKDFKVQVEKNKKSPNMKNIDRESSSHEEFNLSTEA